MIKFSMEQKKEFAETISTMDPEKVRKFLLAHNFSSKIDDIVKLPDEKIREVIFGWILANAHFVELHQQARDFFRTKYLEKELPIATKDLKTYITTNGSYPKCSLCRNFETAPEPSKSSSCKAQGAKPEDIACAGWLKKEHESDIPRISNPSLKVL